MGIVVQKYGGSSVGDLERIGRVADRIVRTSAAGHGVVVVVSAMGNTTDQLLELATGVSPNPDRRELDMLVSVGERITMSLMAMALKDRGVAAISLTGSQSGIVTDESHSDARVIEVRPQRVKAALEQGEVVIVAGFQGVSRTREVTTLGRGGSDTTAVVLAAALEAEYCEICSDVDGVWSADPRLVPEAVKLDTVTLEEALTLARSGAKVLFEDAVRYARDQGVQIVASSTFGPGAGTRLVAEAVVRGQVVAVTGDEHLIRATLDAVGVAHQIASAGGRIRRRSGHQVWIDVRNAHGGLDRVEGLGAPLPVAVVTAVGSGAGEDPRLFDQASQALAGAGIDPAHSGAGGDELWFEVKRAQLQDAVRAVHEALVYSTLKSSR